MTRTRICCLSLLVIGLALLAACSRTAPTPATTITPSPTASRTPTIALTPTPNLTATQVMPLSQEGPWLLLYSEESDVGGIWVLNSDGTGLTQITDNNTDPNYQGRLSLAISPQGGRIAFFYPSMMPFSMWYGHPELWLITLPSTIPRLLTTLHSGVLLPTTTPDTIDPNGDVFAALNHYSSLAWSPDGSTLAFLSAQDGPSVDLYAYSTLTQGITRLTNGPTQALDPSWSPDGRYIISSGARDMNFGVGGSNGPEIDAVWAVRPDGSDLRIVHTYPSDDQSPPSPHRIGWVNNQAYIDSYGMMGCGNFDLTFVDFVTPHEYTLLPGPFNSVGLDPATGTVLVAIPDIPADYDYLRTLCGPLHEPGLYLMSVYGIKPPQRIALDAPASPDTRDGIYNWSPQAKVFFVSSADRLYTVDLRGKVTLIDVPGPYFGIPTVSPDGREWAVPCDQGLWIASPAYPARQIFEGNVGDVLWAPDSSAIWFLSEDILYRAAAPGYEPIVLTGPSRGSYDYLYLRLGLVMP